MKTEISVIVPLYNEELVVNELKNRLIEVLDKSTESFEILFVDDGSTDRTQELVKAFCAADQRIRLIRFSRNFGHQMAVTAGMDRSRGEAVIVIDADLQDPPEVIPAMIEKWKGGCQVVYGVREKREGESFLKLLTAGCFYRILRRMTSVKIPVDTGDFRLIDRKVVREFNQMREQSRFIRGMVSWIGFRQGEVRYTRNPRFAGETKYPLRKMIAFAIDGLISFSNLPLRIASIFGLVAAGISFLLMIYGITSRLFFPRYTISGWASLFTAVLFLGGIQLVSLGILGEYVSRIYREIKQRPLYIIDEEINFPTPD